jgi:hypothetical protein
MESRIDMSDGSSTTEDTKSAGPSPLRLRVGVFLILLWIVPFWALAPYIAHSLSGLSNPPSVAAVTTTILVVQTIIGGRSEVRATSAMIPMNRDHQALTPSCFAVADRLVYPNAVQLRAWSWLPAPT